MTWKSQYGFTGYVDEVAVWTAALTASKLKIFIMMEKLEALQLQQ